MLPDWLQKISGKGCFGSILDFVQTFILFQGFEKNWNVLCRSLFRSLPRATQYVLTITYSFYRIQFKYLSSFSINVPTKYFRLNILLSVFIPLLSRDMFFRMQDREKKRGNYNSRRLNIYHCCFLFFSLSPFDSRELTRELKENVVSPLHLGWQRRSIWNNNRAFNG